jgi:uncharacterized RDD family membrane protein YckC
VAAAVTARPHRAYAGLVSRLSALAVDVGVLTLLCLTTRLVPDFAWEQVLGRPAPQWLTATAGLAAALLPWAYFTLCWWLNGKTIGSAFLGVAVRRHNGHDLTLVQAALRAAIGLLLAPLWMIGLLAVLWDSERRAWHDVLFRSVVVYSAAAHPH